MKGKILHLGPWGYSMTLNNFYKVIRETKKTAIVKEIGSKCVETMGYLSGKEVPSEKEENVNFKEYRVLKNADGTFKGKCGLSSTRTLEVVPEGKSYYFNHCD